MHVYLLRTLSIQISKTKLLVKMASESGRIANLTVEDLQDIIDTKDSKQTKAGKIFMRYSKTNTTWFISRSSKNSWSLDVGCVRLLPSASLVSLMSLTATTVRTWARIFRCIKTLEKTRSFINKFAEESLSLYIYLFTSGLHAHDSLLTCYLSIFFLIFILFYFIYFILFFIFLIFIFFFLFFFLARTGLCIFGHVFCT